MRYRNIFLVILVSMGLSASLSGCSQNEPAAKEDNNRNVKTIAVAKNDFSLENEFGGEIKANEEAGVVSKMAGKVKEILVKVGDSVKKDDVLFTLDGDDMNAQMAQAQAGVDVARANLDRTKNSGYSQQELQAKAQVDADKVAYDDAVKDYEKYKALYDSGSGALSTKDMDGIKLKMELARQKYDASKNNLQLLEGSSGPEATKIAETQLKQALANVELINTQLANLSVRAPISGVITSKNINIGEGVSMGAPAMTISNTNELTAEINVPENLINKFSIGQKLSISIQSLEDKSFNGEVFLVNPSIDNMTKNYKVKVRLNDKSDEIKQGMFAKIKIAVENRSNVIAVPSQAIVTENGVQYAFLVKDGAVDRVAVKIGLSNDKMIEIKSGLNVGDKLIIEGQNFLNVGQKVNELK